VLFRSEVLGKDVVVKRVEAARRIIVYGLHGSHQS